MALGKRWTGFFSGTNTGKIFLKLESDDAALVGILRLNEDNVGLYSYEVKGKFEGSKLQLAGEPQVEIEGVEFGNISTNATLNSKGELEGEWETSVGSAGTFFLLPQDTIDAKGQGSPTPDQLYTARHRFGAVGINKEEIIALAEFIQRDFTKNEVVVTVLTDTEQSRFLKAFKEQKFNQNNAHLIKLFVQEPERGGTNRVVSIELGPHFNEVMTQSANEAWVLGEREKLKKEIEQFERSYATNFKKFGIGFGELLMAGAIVYLPSLNGLRDRFILMLGAIVLSYGIGWLHRRYLPFAAIYLDKKPKGFLSAIGPTALSWVIAVTAALAAALLAGYLQGWLEVLKSD